MLVDVLIIVFAISALFRGRDIGFLRQAGSTVGFFGGLFIGAWLEPHTVNLAHSQTGRGMVTIITTLGCALLLLVLGEYAGLKLKQHVKIKWLNNFDNALGALLSVASLFLVAWLTASVVAALPFPSLQSELHNSRIISAMNKQLPGAPTLIADLGHLIDPNGFPQVFIGSEPIPRTNVVMPSGSALQAAVDRDQASVVKVEGQGCGGVVEGSGFVVSPNEIATNAHVVAGVTQPYVQDSNGTHKGTVVWFDPDLDLAILRVSGLAGQKLAIDTNKIASGTAAAVLGYPGGGPFTAATAAILDEFTATGRNIYGSGNTNRDVYEIQATVIPGNSGGPLVGRDGSVIGVVFAQSTTYQHVGYALTTKQVSTAISQSLNRTQAVSTGQCAE
jgi:S1-C subfamily serine protease